MNPHAILFLMPDGPELQIAYGWLGPLPVKTILWAVLGAVAVIHTALTPTVSYQASCGETKAREIGFP